MGIHHAYDLAAPGKQTWNPTTLVPVMPMYDAKRTTINAILFNGMFLLSVSVTHMGKPNNSVELSVH